MGDSKIPIHISDSQVIITDGNGYIAGMQAVVPEVKAADNLYYDFEGSSWLVKACTDTN